jgi:hypothetical protein
MLSGEHGLTTIVNDENHRNGFSPHHRCARSARMGVISGIDSVRVWVFNENLGTIISDVDHHNEADSTSGRFLIAIIMRILRLIHWSTEGNDDRGHQYSNRRTQSLAA